MFWLHLHFFFIFAMDTFVFHYFFFGYIALVVRFIPCKTLVFFFFLGGGGFVLVVRVILHQTPIYPGISRPHGIHAQVQPPPSIFYMLLFSRNHHFLSMVSMMASICFLSNPDMHLVTLWQIRLSSPCLFPFQLPPVPAW